MSVLYLQKECHSLCKTCQHRNSPDFQGCKASESELASESTTNGALFFTNLGWNASKSASASTSTTKEVSQGCKASELESALTSASALKGALGSQCCSTSIVDISP